MAVRNGIESNQSVFHWSIDENKTRSKKIIFKTKYFSRKLFSTGEFNREMKFSNFPFYRCLHRLLVTFKIDLLPSWSLRWNDWNRLWFIISSPQMRRKIFEFLITTRVLGYATQLFRIVNNIYSKILNRSCKENFHFTSKILFLFWWLFIEETIQLFNGGIYW